jgi:DNA mismatch endonuclease (patch repair protein)
MAAIKGKNTKPEMAVRRLVHRLGYRYVLHGKNLPGRPDLVFPAKRRVIFVHGCFWHTHDCRYGHVVPRTRAEFWQRKRADTVRRDRSNVAALHALGWRVHIVWECEPKDIMPLADRLTAFLDS